jgi:general secretion pathway protein D
MKEDVSDVAQKVPVLGSIPILGRLFRYEEAVVKKTNLMVFLRAKIMRNDAAMQDATKESYQIIRGMQVEQREKGLRLMDDDLLPLLPELDLEDLNISEEDKAIIREAQLEGLKANQGESEE